MSFSALHKLATYLVVASAALSVLLSPEVSLTTGLVVGLAMALSWFFDRPPLRADRWTVIWNIATIAYLLYLAAQVWNGDSVLSAGAQFLFFVLVNKLFNRRCARDLLQAYVVSFLLLVVATTLNTSISYAICFAAYVVFITWGLSLLHLRREMEESYLLRHSESDPSQRVEVERILRSRRVVGGKFLAGTSLLALGVLLGATLVFVLFPRVSFGLFVGARRGGIIVAGFQDKVELGHHGVVRDNPSVVMRVVFSGPPPRQPLRWRGAAFDEYEKGTWRHSAPIRGWTQMVAPQQGLFYLNRPPGPLETHAPAQLRAELFQQEIYLEPLDSPVIFAADRPVAIDSRQPGSANRSLFLPRRGPLGEIHGAAVRTAGLHYLAYSQLSSPPPELLRRATQLRHERLSGFLQIPPEMPARVGRLAREIVRGQGTVYDQVIAIERHLRRNYRYTVRLTHAPALEPIDEFLFVTRQGHCEYFASAMVILLRHLGIHARQVNGFVGGAWNSYGKYLAVRQGDAHAWVEVLFSNVGWVTFDPTPSGQVAAAPPSGLTSGLRELLDTLRMRWLRHVVEYDLRQQVSVFRKAQRALRHVHLRGKKRQLGSFALLLTAAAVGTIGVLFWLRRRRRGSAKGTRRRAVALSAVSRLYARLLALLARAGHAKPPGMTPGELVALLRRRRFSGAELVERFTRCYYEARFSGTAAPTPPAELRALLAELQQALRRGARGPQTEEKGQQQ